MKVLLHPLQPAFHSLALSHFPPGTDPCQLFGVGLSDHGKNALKIHTVWKLCLYVLCMIDISIFYINVILYILCVTCFLSLIYFEDFPPYFLLSFSKQHSVP